MDLHRTIKALNLAAVSEITHERFTMTLNRYIMKKRHCAMLIAGILSCTGAAAQFYSAGNDPSDANWMTRRGNAFRIIYPQQTDSLAVRYLDALERHAPRVGASIGYIPNAEYRRPMPVVLHPFYPLANGSVSWAPRIMNLYTVQEAYAPDPYPWIDQLAIHESRHVSQMQFGRDRIFNPLFWLSGQLATGGLCAIYGGPTFFEGDAVTAETALTRSGRGRTADFLEYYMAAFDSGDWRNWYRWNYGSLKYYTPDHYKVGYMTVAGMRTLYDDPLFSQRFYHNVFSKRTNVLHKTMREASGKKFRKTFREIEQHFQNDWADGYARRAPFMQSEDFTPIPKRFESFTGLTMTDKGLYAVHSGIALTNELVLISSDGAYERVAYRSAAAGNPVWSEASGRLYWSEAVADVRWDLGGTSRIRYYDLKSGTQGDLTREGKLFNPFPDGNRLLAVEYPAEGGSAVVTVSETNGEILQRWQAPDGVQVVEIARSGDMIVASGISAEGFGLYDIEGGFACVLAPQPVKIKQLRTHGGVLHFVCDRTGVNEVYSFGNGELKQLTSTKFGAADYAFGADGETMYFSSLSRDARSIRKVSTDALAGKTVDFTDIHRYAIADKLSEQEAALPAAEKPRKGKASNDISEARNYSKAANLIRLHSWIPLFVSYDNILSMSDEDLYSSVTLGATAFFQNDLGTMSGYMAYSYWPFAAQRNGFELQATYSGWFPVIEANIEYGTRKAYTYRPRTMTAGEYSNTLLWSNIRNEAYWNGTLKAYIPLNFSSGGWSRGIIPQAYLSVGNDIYDKSVIRLQRMDWWGSDEMIPAAYALQGTDDAGKVLFSEYRVSVRGYSMLTTPSSNVYPRLGIGAEIGVNGNLWLDRFYSPGIYAHAYAYLPGLGHGQGWRLTATAQNMIRSDAVFPMNRLNMTPRGMGESYYVGQALNQCGSQLKATVDYAIPFAPLDFAIGQLTYIRNLELIPHADMLVGWGRTGRGRTAYSVGASLSARLGNLAFIPYNSRIGIDFNYNGGSIPSDIISWGGDCERTYIGIVFDIDM